MQADNYLCPFEDPGIGMMEAHEISLVRCALRDGISMFQVGLGLSENVVPQMAMFHHFKRDGDK